MTGDGARLKFGALQRAILFAAAVPLCLSALEHSPPFNDTSLSIDKRVADLVSRLSIAEKIAQTGDRAPGIPRLGIKCYFYRGEACHGVVSEGATVFPQAIALSATWDTALVYAVASAVSDEARALSNRDGRGLTYWSPTINMARDPRWGRNEETYGEDVYLAKKMAVNFIKGMQGPHPRYLKTIATAKHFACNNLESNRFAVSSNADERSLREYYLPVFKAAVVEAGVGSVMSAYNALNGVPCTGNRMLLTDILRKEWGFKGFVVSDCDAVLYLNTAQHYVATNPQAAVVACEAGCDLNCGETYQNYFPIALQTALWSFNESYLNTAVSRILRSRFLLGEFDPPGSVAYANISQAVIGSGQNLDLSLKAARESMVLLKNNGILPLDTAGIGTIAVIGPNANRCMLGGYSTVPSSTISPLRGIIEKIGISKGKKVLFVEGCSVSGAKDQGEFDRAITAAANADVAIMVMGTDNDIIREDRNQWSVMLPGAQEELVRAVYSANPNTVVVLTSGNPLAVPWLQEHVPAIIEAWYNGPFQGRALADALFGDCNPSGKLTQTWVRGDSALPNVNDYAIFKNRTYMYYKGEPLYPFGYGMSYTAFSYSNLTISSSMMRPMDTIWVSSDIRNTGKRSGDEVAQLYIRNTTSGAAGALKLLKGFCRLSLHPEEIQTVRFPLPYEELSSWNLRSHSFTVEDGSFNIMVGASSSDNAVSGRISVSAAPGRSAFLNATDAPAVSRVGIGINVLRIGRGNCRVDIIKPDGRVAYSVNIGGPKTLPLGVLPPGLYLVKTTEGKTHWLSKIVVPR